MTREEMMTLNVNDLVTVKQTGKVYRVSWVTLPYTPEQNSEIEADMARQEAACGYYSGPIPGFVGSVSFVQQRNGKDYGAIRRLKPENIERAK